MQNFDVLNISPKNKDRSNNHNIETETEILEMKEQRSGLQPLTNLQSKESQNQAQTSVLVHSPGSISSLNVQPVINEKLEVVENISAASKKHENSNDIDFVDRTSNKKSGENDNDNDTGSDTESKSVKSTTTMLTDVTDDVGVNKKSMTTSFSAKTENLLNGATTKDNETVANPTTSTTTNPVAAKTMNDEQNRGHSLNSPISQTSTRRDYRDTRPSSRVSNVSFTSQMGMNEVRNNTWWSTR